MSTVYRSIGQAIRRSPQTARHPLSWNPDEHVLSRLAFGAGVPDRERVAKIGVPRWVREQIALGKKLPGYSAVPQIAAQGPLLEQSPAEVRAWLASQGREYGWDAMHQLTRVTLGLQAWSPAQLYEVLVDVFSNHLNVANHNGAVWNTRHAYDRDVIRAHAMGTFTDMLLASARHPAMLTYLDLASSNKSAINENYGRELLELHTVGLVHSENDVVDASRLLTGRTVDAATSTYRYEETRHWTGPVRVLDFAHPNLLAGDGEVGGDLLLRHLAAHPHTARTIARKLCTRLVSDTPSEELIEEVAQAYLAGGTHIPTTVETILRSQEFWTSRGAKTWRPTENLLATLRVLDAQPVQTAAALQKLQSMAGDLGHVPLDHPTPDGYPDVATRWRSSSALLRTWRSQWGLVDEWWGGIFATADPASLYGNASTSGEAVTALAVRLTGDPLPAAHAQHVQTFLGEPATTPMGASRLRWLLVPTLALILNGPSHAAR